MIIEMNISINHIILLTAICSITAGKACISTNLRSHIMNPPDVVIILHQGVDFVYRSFLPVRFT